MPNVFFKIKLTNEAILLHRSHMTIPPPGEALKVVKVYFCGIKLHLDTLHLVVNSKRLKR